jgi:hypothetical protein
VTNDLQDVLIVIIRDPWLWAISTSGSGRKRSYEPTFEREGANIWNALSPPQGNAKYAGDLITRLNPSSTRFDGFSDPARKLRIPALNLGALILDVSLDARHLDVQ